MSHGPNRAAGRNLGQEPYSHAYKVSNPTLRLKAVRRGSYGQYGHAGRFVIGTLPACQQIIRPRGLAVPATNCAVMRLVGNLQKRAGSRLLQHWPLTGGANAKWSGRAAPAEPDQEAGERQQLDASMAACPRRRREECQIESGPGS